MSELREALQQIVVSAVYRQWAAGSPVDASKVKAEMGGTRRPSPSSAFARGLVRIARLTVAAPPPPPPPPPPPTFKKVAPRTVHKEGTSDARYCLRGFPRMDNPDHPWHGRLYDDVASYDDNGLCWGGRSDGDPAVGTVGAKSMDGRHPCELPTFGDPLKNTGSWAI